MKMFSNLTAVFLISAGALAAQSTAANVPSTDPAQGSIWDLTVIFPDAAAAERERLAVIADLPSLAAFKGHLGDSAATLRAALDRRSELLERARRVNRYAFLKVSEDARVQSFQAMAASAADLVDKFSAASSFYDPEITAIGASRITAFETAEPGLARHRRDLALTLRRADHVLSPEAEAAIAASSALRESPSSTHDVFTNAEMPWPTITVHGKPTQLTRGAYRKLLQDSDRETRRAVFEAFTGALGQFKNTQASLLQAHVAGAAYEAKLRHYPTSAAFLLAEDAMPEGSFNAMSEAADHEQPVIDRYLRLRKQALGLSELHTYDFAVPLVEASNYYSLAEGEALVLKALAPLGTQYTDELSREVPERSLGITKSTLAGRLTTRIPIASVRSSAPVHSAFSLFASRS